MGWVPRGWVFMGQEVRAQRCRGERAQPRGSPPSPLCLPPPERLLPRLLCPEDQFPCDVLGCVDATMVCDGRPDCLDGSDEVHCGEPPAAPPQNPHGEVLGVSSPPALPATPG